MPKHTAKERAKRPTAAKRKPAAKDVTRTARPKARTDAVTAAQRAENFRGVPKRLGVKPKAAPKRGRSGRRAERLSTRKTI